MEETNIRKYAQLMKELGLTGLEITDDKSRFALNAVLRSRSVTLYILPLLPSLPRRMFQKAGIISA